MKALSVQTRTITSQAELKPETFSPLSLSLSLFYRRPSLQALLGRLRDDSYVLRPKVLMESTISPLLGVIIIGM